ncbi:MAG: hypothetical protein K0U45_03530 [Alphaproteobacteria bacterium]|nr:hypothetical protein [Alphaproteobacteria bacterium]
MATKDTAKYEKKIVFFLDILGFKDIIEQDKLKPSDIIDRMDFLYDKLIPDTPPEIFESKKVTKFSDTFVISFDYNQGSEIFFTMLDIRRVQSHVLRFGMLLRGGCAIGDLHHGDKNIFGPALNEAYSLEKDIAIYPRIIIPDNIIDEAKNHSIRLHPAEHEKEYIMGLVRKDTDDFNYIDYISYDSVASEFDDPNEDWVIYMVKIRPYIIKGLKSNSPKIRQKYQWLKTKYNATLSTITVQDYIEALANKGATSIP